MVYSWEALIQIAFKYLIMSSTYFLNSILLFIQKKVPDSTLFLTVFSEMIIKSFTKSGVGMLCSGEEATLTVKRLSPGRMEEKRLERPSSPHCKEI